MQLSLAGEDVRHIEIIIARIHHDIRKSISLPLTMEITNEHIFHAIGSPWENTARRFNVIPIDVGDANPSENLSAIGPKIIEYSDCLPFKEAAMDKLIVGKAPYDEDYVPRKHCSPEAFNLHSGLKRVAVYTFLSDKVFIAMTILTGMRPLDPMTGNLGFPPGQHIPCVERLTGFSLPKSFYDSLPFYRR